MATWEVIVGNVGRVFDGTNGFEAYKTYREYVGMSKRGYGRVAGEGVTIWRDGEIVEEYDAPQDESESDSLDHPFIAARNEVNPKY